MKWRRFPLWKVAPPEPSKIQFKPDQDVWLLTLDQIESHTGFILKKRVVPSRQVGNSTFPFDSGNVLYSKLRPYLNKVLWPSEPGIATTELIPLRPHPDILDCAYLTYYLRSNHFLPFA
jgi:type I restriction enzyme S subunit